jgi:hypothetical protein
MLSDVSRKSTSAQAIQHFIKKSTLNLEQHTSAEAGTKSTLLISLSSKQNFDIISPLFFYPCKFVLYPYT